MFYKSDYDVLIVEILTRIAYVLAFRSILTIDPSDRATEEVLYYYQRRRGENFVLLSTLYSYVHREMVIRRKDAKKIPTNKREISNIP